jgi:precorrin-4 methylase
MAQQPPPIHFEDIPLDEARRIGRGPRMDPALYQALKENIQSLDNTATRITLPEGTSPTTMKNRLLRVAAALNTPLTVRRVPGGLLFWRSSDEDVQQAKEVAGRLRTARSKGQTQTRGNRRRRA